MSDRERAGAAPTMPARASAASGNDEVASRDDLQRKLEETRQSITQTVTEIKDAVVDKYETVKESVADTLDWREQFRSHPLAWSIGALSVGYVIGTSLAASFKGAKHDDELLGQLAVLGERFSEELTKRGMSILAPALTGTVLVPMLASKIKELTGFDLSDLPAQLLGQADAQNKSQSKSRKKSVKKKKGGKKKDKTAQSGAR